MNEYRSGYLGNNAAIAVAKTAHRDAPRKERRLVEQLFTTPPGTVYYRALHAEEKAHADLLRDLFGPLSCRPVRLDPSWRIPQMLAQAQAIYGGRIFDGLPILADALEKAGCTDADILDHCRGPGPHVRGCWAVGLILDKK